MELTIAYNPELDREIALKYFRFENAKIRGRLIHYYIIFALSISLGFFGIYAQNTALAITGFGLLLYPIFIIVRYHIQRITYLKHIDKQVENNTSNEDNSLNFSFDESKFTVSTKDYKVDTNWTAVKRFEENDGDLYLYSKNNELINIISVQKIGESNYSAFREQLIDGQKNDE